MKAYIITLCAIVTVAFASCDKGDMEVRKLNRGEGIWAIESLTVEEYDSTGANRINSVTGTDLGEFVFFKEGTLNALFDEHFVVVDIFDTSGVVTGHPGGVYYDDNRVKIDADSDPRVMNDQFSLNGVWTVEENGRKAQTWTMFLLDANATLKWKYILTIRKK
jgi:hypothetical protein